MTQPTAPIGSIRPAPNVNPSPRQRFQESQGAVSRHREMIQTEAFVKACDYSLLHMQWLLAQQEFKDFNQAAANAVKLTGVMEFLSIFRTLGESSPMMPKIVDRDNLKQPA